MKTTCHQPKPMKKTQKTKEAQYSNKQKFPNFPMVELKKLNPKFYTSKGFKLFKEIVI